MAWKMCSVGSTVRESHVVAALTDVLAVVLHPTSGMSLLT